MDRSLVRTVAFPALSAATAVGVLLFGRPDVPEPPPREVVPPDLVDTYLVSPVGPEHRALAARTAEKQRVAADLIAGRCSLAEAAAAFYRATTAGPPTVSPDYWPGRTVEEKFYRQVIRFVDGYESEGVPPAERTAVRLREEFDCRLAAGPLPPFE